MNILLLTSCNRIKQTLLSLSLNCQTIKEKFSIVIVDNSTIYQEDNICGQHQAEDPYNVVKPYNYCSDISLLHKAESEFRSYFPHIEEFKVIHSSPRLTKQRGEATLIALGLAQASLIGNHIYKTEKNFCMKINGVSILKWDVISQLPNLLENSDVLTYHRANIGGYERSTRVLACRPEILSGILLKEGWYNWCDDNSGVCEQRFANIISREIPDRINFTNQGDDSVLLEGAGAFDPLQARAKIKNFIMENNLRIDLPYIKEFMEGEIWE